MHCHCATNNRAPFTDGHSRWTFLQTRGETRYPGGVSVSCLASPKMTEKPTSRKFENQWTTMTRLAATKNYDYNTIADRLGTVTTVITATKIKERHYNNVLSFPSFTTPDRENTRQRTIDGLQPSPPSPRGSSTQLRRPGTREESASPAWLAAPVTRPKMTEKPTDRKFQWTTLATKNYDYNTIADRLRTPVDSSPNSNKNKRKTL